MKTTRLSSIPPLTMLCYKKFTKSLQIQGLYFPLMVEVKQLRQTPLSILLDLHAPLARNLWPLSPNNLNFSVFLLVHDLISVLSTPHTTMIMLMLNGSDCLFFEILISLVVFLLCSIVTYLSCKLLFLWFLKQNDHVFHILNLIGSDFTKNNS